MFTVKETHEAMCVMSIALHSNPPNSVLPLRGVITPFLHLSSSDGSGSVLFMWNALVELVWNLKVTRTLSFTLRKRLSVSHSAFEQQPLGDGKAQIFSTEPASGRATALTALIVQSVVSGTLVPSVVILNFSISDTRLMWLDLDDS